METIVLNNGVAMPTPGFGTAAIGGWQKDSDKVAPAVKVAIDTGYRHIDTAAVYGNERGVGEGIRRAGVPRDDVFLVTKVWNHDQGYDETLHAFDRSLARLGFSAVDLYLIHWPNPEKTDATWRAMERLYEEKRVRCIGVSNFRQSDLEQIAARGNVRPVCNQIEVHPYLTQEPLRAYCTEHGIQVVSWSPLGSGEWSGAETGEKPIVDPVIEEIAATHTCSPARVILRWHMQNALVPLPKSETPAHIRDNFARDLPALNEIEMRRINGLNRDRRFGLHPDVAMEATAGVMVPA